MTNSRLQEILKALPPNDIVRFWNYAELREENIADSDIRHENGVILID